MLQALQNKLGGIAGHRLSYWWKPLAYRDYRHLWIAQFARGTAYWIQLVTVPLLVVALGGGGTELGIATALQYAPTLLAPIGGAWADRWEKRRALVFVNVLLAGQAAALAVLLWLDEVTLPRLLVLAAGFGFANALEAPFRQAMIPELVPRASLANAVLLHQAPFSLTWTLIPAATGALVATQGFSPAFCASALCSAVSAGLLWKLNTSPTHRAKGTNTTLWQELIDAMSYILASQTIRFSLALLAGGTSLGLAFQAVLPLLAREQLGVSAAGYGTLIASIGFGATSAAILMTRVTSDSARSASLAGAAGLGVLSITLPHVSSPFVAAVLLMLSGAFFVLLVSGNQIQLQLSVADELRGRVIGCSVAVFNGAVAVGSLAIGILTDNIGVTRAITVAGILTLVVVLALSRTWGRFDAPLRDEVDTDSAQTYGERTSDME
jgi:MFS family permease